MDYSLEFETFWKDYPKRWYRRSGRYYKVGKWEAFQAWKRLSQKDRNDILIKVKYMKDGEFVLDAHRWLKKRRFDDIEIQEPKPKVKVIIHERTYTPEEELEREEKGRIWKAKYEKRKKKLFEMPTVPEKDFNDKRNKALNALKS